MGRFEDGADRIVLDGQHDIYLLESDVNELAQAKGANVAGLRTVFSHFGVGFDDIDVFYLAGGFGRHLKVDASKRIGLIPNLPDDRIVRVGNAAIEGASHRAAVESGSDWSSKPPSGALSIAVSRRTRISSTFSSSAASSPRSRAGDSQWGHSRGTLNLECPRLF